MSIYQKLLRDLEDVENDVKSRNHSITTLLDPIRQAVVEMLEATTENCTLVALSKAGTIIEERPKAEAGAVSLGLSVKFVLSITTLKFLVPMRITLLANECFSVQVHGRNEIKFPRATNVLQETYEQIASEVVSDLRAQVSRVN